MKNRIQFELSDSRLKELNDMQSLMQCDTRKELLNIALSLLSLAIELRQGGRSLAIHNLKDDTYSNLTILALSKVGQKA